MEEFRHENHNHYPHEKGDGWKYLGIILATLLGSFLAFYFAVNCSISHFFSKGYALKQMHKMEKYVQNDINKTDKDFSNTNKMFSKNNVIELFKTPDSYKFIVDLIPFQGNANIIDIKIENNSITISGESDSVKNNTDTFVKMSQTYNLSKNAKPDKIYKKKIGNKLVITIPIED